VNKNVVEIVAAGKICAPPKIIALDNLASVLAEDQLLSDSSSLSLTLEIYKITKRVFIGAGSGTMRLLILFLQ